MSNIKTSVLMVVSLGCWLLAGCGPYAERADNSSTPSYGFALLNRTGEPMEDVTIEWGELRLEERLAGPNGLQTRGYYTDPIPTEARITWTSPEGTSHDLEAIVSCREGHPQSADEVCIVVLPDDQAVIEVISEVERGDRDSPYFQYRIGIDGPHYIIATCNATGHNLTDIEVYFGEHQVNSDPETEPLTVDANNGWRFTHGLPYPITDEVDISWKADGQPRNARLSTQGLLPADLDDVCIVIVIDDEPRLTTIPWGSEQYWWMNVRP